MLAAAKNIILAGVKSVALHDDGAVEFSDLSAQVLPGCPAAPREACLTSDARSFS